MSINRPRRIFRSALPRLDPRALLALLGICLVAAAGVSVAMLPHREKAPAPPGEDVSAPPAYASVIDAGTLKLRDRVVLLQGVEPPRRGTPCRSRDGSEDDCAARAANGLAALVREARIDCRITGADHMGRPYAICNAGGIELNQAMIAAGWAHGNLNAK